MVGKDVLPQVDAFWLTVVRYSVAALMFIVLLVPRGTGPWKRLRCAALPLAVRGVMGFGVFGILLLLGLSLSVPSHSAVIVATVPITAQLVRWALDGVRPGWITAGSAVLALAGVVIVSGVATHGAASDAHTGLGDGIAFAGSLGWVWYTRGPARFPQLDVLEYTALSMLAAWPLLVVAALVATSVGIASPPSVAQLQQHWHALLYISVMASGFAVLAFNYGVAALGAVTGTAFMNFVPVSALLMAAALGKPPLSHELVGTAMVVAALLIHTATRRAPPLVPAIATHPGAVP